MSTGEAFTELARLETQIQRERKFLADQEASFTNQILNTGNLAGCSDKFPLLAGVREALRLWPEREKLLKAKIFSLRENLQTQTQ